MARDLDRLRRAEGSVGPYLPQAICVAHDRLARLTGPPAVRTNRALAVGFRDGPLAGPAALDEVADDTRLARSNLVATVRTDLPRRAGRPAEAVTWYRATLEANGSAPGRAFLRRRIAECGG